MTKIISETLNSYATNMDKWSGADRSKTVGASEVGQCARKTFWVKHPHKAPNKDADYVETWGARMRGSMFEKHFWVPALRARFGSRLLYAGEDQTTLVKGALSATPDGLLVKLTRHERIVAETGANCIVPECKTIDPRANLYEAKPVNTFQTQVQMGLFRDTTQYKPERAVISYTDTSFWNETTEFIVKFDQKVYQAAHERARQIMNPNADGLDFEPEGWMAGGNECKYCPYAGACGISRRDLPFTDAPVDPQFAAEMTDMAREYRQAEADRDIFEERMRKLQYDIKERLREKGIRRIPGILTWSSVKGRTNYDTKAMIEQLTKRGVDCTAYESQSDPSDRLTITIKSS